MSALVFIRRSAGSPCSNCARRDYDELERSVLCSRFQRGIPFEILSGGSRCPFRVSKRRGKRPDETIGGG